jgi:hydrogenase maturation protease
MIEAVYLMDHVPDIHLFTVSIKEINPMTIELNEKVRTAIPEIIQQILTLCEKLHLKKL